MNVHRIILPLGLVLMLLAPVLADDGPAAVDKPSIIAPGNDCGDCGSGCGGGCPMMGDPVAQDDPPAATPAERDPEKPLIVPFPKPPDGPSFQLKPGQPAPLRDDVRVIINGQEVAPGRAGKMIVIRETSREERGEGKYGFLGIVPEPVGPPLADQLALDDGRGLLVAAVEPGTPAAKAGLAVHDVIVQIDEQILYSVEQLHKLIAGRKPGSKVKLTYVHKARTQVATVELGGTAHAAWRQPRVGPTGMGEVFRIEGVEGLGLIPELRVLSGQGSGGQRMDVLRPLGCTGQCNPGCPHLQGAGRMGCTGQCNPNCPHLQGRGGQLGQPGQPGQPGRVGPMPCGGRCNCPCCPMKQARPPMPGATMPGCPMPGMMPPGCPMPRIQIPLPPGPQGIRPGAGVGVTPPKASGPGEGAVRFNLRVPPPAGGPAQGPNVAAGVVDELRRALEPMREDIPPKVWKRIDEVLDRIKARVAGPMPPPGAGAIMAPRARAEQAEREARERVEQMLRDARAQMEKAQREARERMERREGSEGGEGMWRLLPAPEIKRPERPQDRGQERPREQRREAPKSQSQFQYQSKVAPAGKVTAMSASTVSTESANYRVVWTSRTGEPTRVSLYNKMTGQAVFEDVTMDQLPELTKGLNPEARRLLSLLNVTVRSADQ